MPRPSSRQIAELIVSGKQVTGVGGLASDFALGSNQVNQRLPFTGLTSGFALGTFQVNRTIPFTGLVSGFALGTATVAGGASTSFFTGLASDFVLGTLQVNMSIGFTAIDSDFVLGSHTAYAGTPLFFTSFINTQQFGSAQFNMQVSGVGGLASSFTLGTLRASPVITLSGLSSGFALGALGITRTASGVGGLETGFVLGTITVHGGPIFINFTGLPSSFTIGSAHRVLKQAVPGPQPAEFIYKIVVANLDGEPMEEIPVKNLQYSYTLNGAGTINFVMDIRHPKCTRALLDPGKRELYIYRNTGVKWGGYLWTAAAGQEGDVVRFGGEGFYSRLRRRKIRELLAYSQVDQSDIAWDLIDYTQSRSDLGIVRSEDDEQHGVLRDRTYYGWEAKPINEAINQLSNVENGFDFDINQFKEWSTYYPQRGQRTGFVFEMGKNIASAYSALDATAIASDVTATGAGTGFTMLTSTYRDNETFGAYGLLETDFSFKDVDVQETLDEHASEEQYKLRSVRDKPQLQVYGNDPEFDEYGVGDEVFVKVDRGYQQVSDWYRIIALVVAQSNSGHEAFGVYLDNNNTLEEVEA